MLKSFPLHSALLLLVPSATLIAESPSDTAWQVLGGPEKEKGDAVQIIEGAGENLEVLVAGRRGTVMRRFTETPLPATLTFRFQSSYDPNAREVPTELFGTGDFRIFVGTWGKTGEKTGLGGYQSYRVSYLKVASNPNRNRSSTSANQRSSFPRSQFPRGSAKSMMAIPDETPFCHTIAR